MKIRNVKIYLNPDKLSSTKATADVTIKDGFVVRNIPIVQGEKRLYLDFHFDSTEVSTFMPFSPVANHMIERIVIAAYLQKVITQQNAIEST
ncbi:septation protein SpoVG family protein [Scatolibacter rhodanostii]|uniref:septation protein SpoVG family protein n=1 Tax=Scatolibacter rhodanostii TaxID=2014781 RepID=UPI000C081A89|nr:septation protein SpoVG family protein [Scatolibacter rhodanostii]